ncbi:MAG TPA: hypothetical protein VF763_02730, partial [Candidatus Limnocylindrales bacterium]
MAARPDLQVDDGLGARIGLPIAAAVLLLAAASLVALALVSGGAGFAVGTDSVVMLLIAGWLAVAALETVRRRHFAIALLTPLALALVDLGYVVATGRAEGFGAVLGLALAALLVASS